MPKSVRASGATVESENAGPVREPPSAGIQDTKLLTRKDVASLLGVTEATVSALVKNGQLPVILVQARGARGCRCFRFTRKDIQEYIDSKRVRFKPVEPKKRGRKPKEEEV